MYNLEKDKDHYFQLGKIIKTYGYSGELVFLIESDDPGHYSELEMVFINIEGSLVPYFVQEIEFNEDRAIVKLEDIDNLEHAREFTGRELYLPISMLKEMSDNKFYFHEIIGFRVVDDEHGDIGLVDSILERQEQEIIRILKNNTEILVPLSDEMIRKIDRKKNTIYLTTPQGLIDLYL